MVQNDVGSCLTVDNCEVIDNGQVTDNGVLITFVVQGRFRDLLPLLTAKK